MQLSPNRECLLAADCLHACTRDFRSRHRPSASRRRTQPRISQSVALALRRERFRGLFACEQIGGGGDNLQPSERESAAGLRRALG